MKKTSKKNKIIILTAIALIIVIIGILIGTNAIKINILTGKFNSANNNQNNGNLLPEYIKAGITLGGVTGTLEDLDTSDATATPEDIAKGKTAYVKGKKITGTRIVPISDLNPDEVYYADLPGKDGKPDGIPDGVIYADLAVGGSGEWGTNGNGKYDIPTKTNLKQYYIEEENYDGVFGKGKVIAPMEETSGNDRFYVMSLEDVDNIYWYRNAMFNMSDYSTTTSKDFGKGKDNTDTMIEKWNNEEYGAQDPNDMWGLIQEKVNDGWFVPSRDEWNVFSEKFKMNQEKCFSYDMNNTYWSSSQYDDTDAYFADYTTPQMSSSYVAETFGARLSTTF